MRCPWRAGHAVKGDTVTHNRVSGSAMLLGLSGETRRRNLQRVVIAVGDECRTGGQNTRCDTGRQGLKVGIHNRVLDRVEREIQLVCWTRLRAGEH